MAANSTDDSKQHFIKLLHELFQLDKPELDFGLYRIMHAKSDQLSRFISEDLSKTIEAAFAEQGEQQLVVMRQNVEEKRKQAEELGAPDPDTVPAVKQAQAAYEVAKRERNASSDIFDHLYRFFSRYYDKGDFMSRRRHVAENDSRAAPYAVPYDGREVYLHWANKDQYYVKSSETLANFTFNLNEALKKLHGNAAQAGLGFDTVDQALKVHCRVVDATEGEHNDVKESTERFFIIHDAEPVRLEGADLVLQFEYRPDPDKNGQSSTWQKKRLEEAEDAIMQALHATDGVAAYRDGLATPAPTDKQKDRTLLRKYLQQYTARNTMDYFIHKDLGGFLSRELDFYIKNEILRLDDIDDADVLIVEQQLKKIQVLRKIAKQIITFLAQLENFQKKLWLKKKFVTQADYCLTLDYIEDEEPFLKELFFNEAQRRQWKEIYGLDLEQLDLDFSKYGVSGLVKNEKYRYLMVDTACLDNESRLYVVSLIGELDNNISGVLVNSENFQALRLFGEKFSHSISTVYIDPPYNTGEDGFLYKDGYSSSSWLSMIIDRLSRSIELLSRDASISISLDGGETPKLMSAMYEIADVSHCGSFVWRTRNTDNRVLSNLSVDHEYIHVYTMNSSPIYGRKIDRSNYKNEDNDPRGPYTTDPLTGKANANDRPNLHYTIKNPETGDVFPPHPDFGWITDEDGYKKLLSENRIYWPKNSSTGRPRKKRFASEASERAPVSSMEIKIKQGEGNQVLSSLFGEKVMNFPKPVSVIRKAIDTTSKKDSFIIDFFAGSGTLGQSVIELNREDGGDRKYCLVEVGEHFQTVLKPRLQKAAYSESWVNGHPYKGNSGKLLGISQAFKYLQLESYDDTLNNLELDENPQRDALMEKNPELRHDYTLKYMLDVETRGSASLLNIEGFRDPEGYTLRTKQPGSDESRDTAIDLVETFNWLIGLHVSHLDKPRTYVARFERETDPELPEDQNTRLKAASLRENDEGAYWIRQVEGHVRRIPGSNEDLAKVLVVWRKLTDDSEKDAAVLEALLEKYKIGTTDSEFDAIYINGPHGLNLSGSARGRVHSLEETFHARMWEGCEDGI